MVLLAAFKVVLHRYTGQADLLVGSPVANRPRRELEPLIGYFVNMVVMRTDLGNEPDFLEVLRRVRESALGAFDHQELPFEKLVEALIPVSILSFRSRSAFRTRPRCRSRSMV
jgi:non-ribosomal peptide synthetase component F